MSCKICKSKFIKHELDLKIFNKFVKLYSCNNCNYCFTEKPYWLEKSYSSVINSTDIGLLARNIFNSKLVSLIIKHLNLKNQIIIDIAGGYGVLVRLLRDKGINAYWIDKYCENLFASSFEHKFGQKYALATGFEFLEHLEDPMDHLSDIYKNFTENFIFSTLIMPFPTPKNWWYYGEEHGQHISFYRVETLKFIANKFNKKLSSNKTNYHMIGDKKINYYTFKFLIKFSDLYDFCFNKNINNLTNQDYNKIINQLKK